MFRGDSCVLPLPQAVSVTQYAIARALNQAPTPTLVFYIPFMHSENLDHQRQSVELFRQLRDEDSEKSAFLMQSGTWRLLNGLDGFPRNQILVESQHLKKWSFFSSRVHRLVLNERREDWGPLWGDIGARGAGKPPSLIACL